MLLKNPCMSNKSETILIDLYLGFKQMHHTIGHSFESDGSEEEDDQDDIRVDGGHVDHLFRVKG